MRRLFVLLFLVFFVATPGCGPGADDGVADASDDLYTCGMHPNVVQEGPGSCPICGMDLTPMKGAAAGSASDPAVFIDPTTRQQMGVRTEVVARQPVFRHLRTIGQVEVGEDQLSVVNLRYSGWVEKLRVEKTGDPVSAGQVLFEVYSPELVAAQEDYLLALESQGADSRLAQSARRKLDLFGLAERDIDGIVTAGETRRTMPVRAPASGFVLHKNVVEGARVAAGQDLYRIGNLKQIWVTAEIYEHDAPWVEVGQPAQMELSYQPGVVSDGKVAYIYPTLDSKSRTLTVRLEFNNRGIRLKPGMFATVYIEFRRKDGVIAVPSEAILHTGRRQVVFVARGDGHFEPREVKTGLTGDRHMTEVLSGLSEGEEVVVSGQFLIDSESQLQEAIRKMTQPDGDAAAEHRGHDHEGNATVWSCPMHPAQFGLEPGRCSECGMDFVERVGTEAELEQLYGATGAQPGQFTCPMHPEVVADGPGRCPECGMFLQEVAASSEDAP